MLIQDSNSAVAKVEAYSHRTQCPPDDNGPVVFKWHFHRGILDPRMSGFELAGFILTQMPGIIPLLAEQPRVQAEFRAMMVLLATSPRQAIDRLLPWIKTIIHEEEDDIIYLSLYDKTEQPTRPTWVMP